MEAELTPREQLLHVLKYSGITATILHTIKLEILDPRTRRSRLAETPKQAINQMLISLSDIPEHIWHSLITGSLLSDSKCIIDDETLRLRIDYPNVPQDQTAKGLIIEKILQSREIHGQLSFQVKSRGGKEDWIDIEDLGRCSERLLQFYRSNPEADRCFLAFSNRRGPLQRVKDPKRTGLSDVEINGHLIYAHWFVDCSNTQVYYKSPTPRQLYYLVEKMQYYASSPKGDREKQEHRKYCSMIDNQEEFSNPLNWTKEENEKGLRKFFAKDSHNHTEVASKITNLNNVLIPKLLQYINSTPDELIDQPAIYPFSEVGFTGRPFERRREHNTHSGTAYALGLLEEIAAWENKGSTRRFCWRYVTIVECRYNADRWNLELFFSRLCQSYFWLGGFNSQVAATATPLAEGRDDSKTEVKSISTQETYKRLAAMNFDQIKKNIDQDTTKLNRLQEQWDTLQRTERAQQNVNQLEPKFKAKQKELDNLKEQLAALQLTLKSQMAGKLEANISDLQRLVDKAEEVAEAKVILEKTKAFVAATKAKYNIE